MRAAQSKQRIQRTALHSSQPSQSKQALYHEGAEYSQNHSTYAARGGPQKLKWRTHNWEAHKGTGIKRAARSKASAFTQRKRNVKTNALSATTVMRDNSAITKG